MLCLGIAFRPATLPEYLYGQNPKKKKCPFHFRKIHPPRKSKEQGTFFFFGLPSEARGWRGFLGAYDLGQSHHALHACDIICFESRFELGTINTLIQNSTTFWKPEGGTRFARPRKKLVLLRKVRFWWVE
ncbi:MAG: hypothetical protein A3B74_04735 [Candidatus Kerfeldbacteria bacterium RIFCSPHIGHO2_02_FULL_42_14]|uniref:Uncharacterized protein n=1 Tax=Candidatus Kerfeldbacteria bacterium RIFCSPHIGHO2_02_FULL_42_14 TaxID=1798540 RepID=A0A1G2AP11_9BACT|nr:MAG: hypothetical protein A3B74_04735 [Candidatus Kerfeldbacteria bacterium RIFCSPHIGHO2_02_FULL_42_14]OGY81030.1 MAG: hypothetical protein A3E60_03455 [Candidatus Kerfeldbacteria bacterium RIFCSPHIGHO2_12_FULL_42_13]OGY84847.1 MAG: hypothetical protein A3I91_05100 [Candidatus Kerfeldbacteria bacterium RIFCSPLOWO2_02_FULL_42_19]OGY85651.1 MAG: hypothetical protein A3G01_04740 [Candidatus Kerfeldbacteria bacterium RIFCSPLOWO2_12_FULL_43_9]